MKISLRWEKPLRLRDDSRLNQLYYGRGIERLSAKPGVYVFARKFGKNIVPLYIGQASRLRGRIEGQFNNLRLMMGIKNAQAGHRILTCRTPVPEAWPANEQSAGYRRICPYQTCASTRT